MCRASYFVNHKIIEGYLVHHRKIKIGDKHRKRGQVVIIEPATVGNDT